MRIDSYWLQDIGVRTFVELVEDCNGQGVHGSMLFEILLRDEKERHKDMLLLLFSPPVNKILSELVGDLEVLAVLGVSAPRKFYISGMGTGERHCKGKPWLWSSPEDYFFIAGKNIYDYLKNDVAARNY